MAIKKVNDASLTSVADAIREKGGTTANLYFPDGFVDAIEAIPTGGDTLAELYIDRTLKSYELTSGGTLPNYMFAGSNIENVVGDSKTIIGSNSFRNCAYLKSVSFALVNNVMGYAFYECYRFENLNFPELLTAQEYSFFSCSGALSVNMPKLQNAYRYSFSGVGSSSSPIEVISLPEVLSLQSYSLDNIKAKKVLCPKLTWLGQYLAQNSLIEEFTIPATIQTVESRALWNMRKLKKLVIEADLTTFPTQLLNNNESLEEIDMTACSQVPILSGNYLQNLPNTCVIKVPAALEEEWKTATNWASFASQIQGV